MPTEPQRSSRPRVRVAVRHIRALHSLELIEGAYGRWAFPRHVHEEYVIGVMTSGAEALKCQRQTYVAPKGSLILLNPGEAHANWSVDDRGFAYRMCYVPAPLLQLILEEHGARNPQAWFRQAVIEGSPVARQVLSLHASLSDHNSALENESWLTEVLLRLVAHHSDASLPSIPTASLRIALARDYLEAHFPENISLRDLAAMSGMGSFQFLRRFREQIGLPPAEYQSHLRLIRAKALLREGMPIAHVAVDVGFSDQSHLTRRFKAVIGMTPGTYLHGARM